MKLNRGLGLKFLAIVLVVFAPLLFSLSHAEIAQASQMKVLKIGALFALSGPASQSVKECADGAKAAAEWLNEKGGVAVEGEKYRIELVVEDNKSTPDGAAAATNKLVFKDKVKYIIGPVVPPFAIAMAPITEPNKVLRNNINGVGHPAEMNPDLRYTFATYKNMDHIPFAYQFFMDSYPKAKKVAIISPEEPGGQFARGVAQKEAEKRGLEVVFNEGYPFGTEDFYPILTKALSKKPDAIDMTVGLAPWFAGIIKQARQLGFEGPMFAHVPTGDIYLARDMIGEKFAHDIFFIEPDLKSPKMPPIIKEAGERIRKMFGVDLLYAHIAGWEALWTLVQAIEKANSLDTTKIAETWEKMDSINAMYGKAKMGGMKTFGINHVMMRPVPITRLNNGKVEFVKFFNVSGE
jgi:branched-chain amino acid transport system substrate-binding protein